MSTIARTLYRVEKNKSPLKKLAKVAAGIGGAVLLGDQLLYDPVNPRKHLQKFDAFGEELNEWKDKAWDPKNDPDFVNKSMARLQRELTNELDTMLVPRSAASEKATDYVMAFLQMTEQKQDLPSGDTMSAEDFR